MAAQEVACDLAVLGVGEFDLAGAIFREAINPRVRAGEQDGRMCRNDELRPVRNPARVPGFPGRL